MSMAGLLVQGSTIETDFINMTQDPIVSIASLLALHGVYIFCTHAARHMNGKVCASARLIRSDRRHLAVADNEPKQQLPFLPDLPSNIYPLPLLKISHKVAMFASAADIPEELFELVLDILTRDVTLIRKPEDRAPAKRCMNRCSLVCKFWASRCRPRIFSHLTLRSIRDAHTLLSLSHTVRHYIVDLFLEETEPCEPWTHIVYRAVASGKLSLDTIAHKLDGACTPTSVQTLRSLHPSLPQRTPVAFRDHIFVHVMNYRLQVFTDIAQLVRKLLESKNWQLEFTNISWIKPPEAVPSTLGMKNRAMCDQVEVRQCVERWPFVWLCISTRPYEHKSRTRAAYLSQEEAFRLGALVRCLTAPAGHEGRPYCSHTLIHRKVFFSHVRNAQC